jgi:hypothetical protein
VNDLSDEVGGSFYRYVAFDIIVLILLCVSWLLMQFPRLDVNFSCRFGGIVQLVVLDSSRSLLAGIGVAKVVGVAADEARPLLRHGGGRGEAKKSSSPSFSRGITSF